MTPGALLQPVVAQYDTLAAAVAKVDPAELVKPLSDVISELSASLSGAQLTEPLAGLTGLIDRVKALVASLSPGLLLTLLIEASTPSWPPSSNSAPASYWRRSAEVFDLISAPVNALEPPRPRGSAPLSHRFANSRLRSIPGLPLSGSSRPTPPSALG